MFSVFIEQNAEISYHPKVFISIDETTDKASRQVAIVMIGTLEKGKPGRVFLAELVELKQTNGDAIVALFKETYKSFWPNGNGDNVLLFVSDGAPYMKKAGRDLRPFFRKMVHVTCIAHAIHLLATTVAKNYPLARQAIMQTKAVFRISPKRRKHFKQCYPTTPLPPRPCETRWGTFLSACGYYAFNFSKVQVVVRQFDSKDSECISAAQQALTTKAKNEIVTIDKQFSYLGQFIERAQTRNLSLSDELLLVNQISDQLNNNRCRSKAFKSCKTKWAEVVESNHGLAVLEEIAKWRRGEVSELSGVKDNIYVPTITADDVPYFDFCPLASADVERAFSRYGNIFTDLRRSAKVPSLKSQMIVQWNANG